MANEATKVTLLGNQGDPVEMTIAAGAVIPKGSIMNINTSPQTATIATADELICGIAAEESTATSTATKLSVWTHGVFTVSSTTGFTFGKPVKMEGVNLAINADDDTVQQRGEVLGLAMQTAGAGGTGDVLINIGS